MSSQAFTLSIDTSLIGLGTDAVRATAILRRATVFDSFVIVPDLKESIVLTAGVGTVKLLPNTQGSVYEFLVFNAAGNKILGCFFIMPEADAALVDLDLLTAWGGDSNNTNSGNNGGRRRIVRYTVSSTLKLSDAGCIIECDSATPMTLTVPAFASVAFLSAIFADVVQLGEGSVTVVGGVGVTVESNGLVLDKKDSKAFLYRSLEVNRFILSSSPKPPNADWLTLANRPDNLVSLGGLTGAVNKFTAFSGLGTMILKTITDFGYSFVAAVDAAAAKALLLLTKSDVGLSNVDNTSDVNKPVSTATQTALNAKEPTITAGSISQYFRGDKTLGTFATDVRAVVLTGLSTATATAVAATDSILIGIGKLQAQVNAKLDATANAVSATKLVTARNINGVAFDGTANITIADSTKEPTIAAGTIGQYYRGDKSWQNLATVATTGSKADVGLSNVDNTSDVNKPVSTAQSTADTNTLNSAKSYADSLVVGLFDFRGNYDASTNLFPTTGGSGVGGAVLKGDIWRVSVAGTLGGVAVRVGDSIFATIDTPAQVAGNWGSMLLELGYNPEDVANKVTAFSSPTNAQYPSALLVKTQLDLKINDVTNGTGTGATQVITPVAGTREIARIGAASADVVVTQGAAGAPNTIGLNGTTLKYWAETSVGHASAPTTTQVLTWKPKTPNGTFEDAKTILNIPVKAGLTLRNPAGTFFPVDFTGGLDLQLSGADASRFAHINGVCIGNNNKTGGYGLAVGYGNDAVVGGAHASCQAQLVGYQNTAQGAFSGASATSAVAFGSNNSTTDVGVAIGNSNSVSSLGQGGVVVGNNCWFSGHAGVAVGLYNTGESNQAGHPTVIFGAHSSSTGGQSSGNIIVGLSATSGSQTNSILIGKNITANAPNSIIVATASNAGNLTDQGIANYQQFGRNAQIPIGLTLGGLINWNNTAWIDVTGVSFLPQVTASTVRFKAEFNVVFSHEVGGGSPAIPTRRGVIAIDYWKVSTSISKTTLLMGDSDFLTYFDFQLVPSGEGVKLQYKFASNPAGGSPNGGQMAIWGIFSQTKI